MKGVTFPFSLRELSEEQLYAFDLNDGITTSSPLV